MFVSDADLSFMISAFHCFLEFPRKLPRAKPCSDPNRVREPGEVEFDIEVRTCPISNLLLFLDYRDNTGRHSSWGWGRHPTQSVVKIFIK